ncbi:MAG: MoaD/ThiS family protein [Kiloniellales bacterium]|jgi:sulfur carrier protein ThiS|nr:MoaD/ThiS family protein [Kiloniellales bacterium]
MLDCGPAGLGHNVADVTVEVEVRFFNAIARYAGPRGRRQRVSVPAGTTVGELAERLGVPRSELFLVLVNGRDITPGLVGDAIRDYHVLDDGDVVALSGPVPYSYGYGSPVV